MLDTLRRGANTTFAKILMGLLTLSFIGWGVGSRLGNLHSETIATVGDTTISLGEFQRAYQRQSQAMSRQFGQSMTPDMAQALGVPQQVLSSLMAEATIKDVAAEMGLGLSGDRLAKAIADDPTLRPQGAKTFDRTYFAQLLNQNGVTEDMYIKQRRAQELGDQLQAGLVGGFSAPKAMVEAVYRFQNEQRTVEYLTLARAHVEPIPAPADDVLKTWFDGHRDEFKAPEFRTVTVLEATPEAVADPASVSDDDVAREYERTRSGYMTAEQRRIQQILYPSVEAADAAAAKLKAGSSFDDLIAEQQLKPEDVDLGLLTRDKVVDPAVAQAAFALSLSTPSDPVKSAFGAVILRVTEIRPEEVKPLATVAGDIRKAIAAKFAERSVLETHDEIEDALAGGATLKEVADRFKLKLQTLETDPDGNGLDGEPIADIPEQAKLLKAAFEAEEGSENDPIQVGRGFLWYEIAKVTPGRERTLDEVKDKAVTAWTDEEAQRRLTAKADEMVAAMKAGKAIVDLAQSVGVEVETAINITRQSDDVGLGEAGVMEAFKGPEGLVSSVPGLDGTRVVLRVASVTEPPMTEGAGDAVDIADKLGGAMANGLFGQYLDAAREAVGTTVNQPLIEAAIGVRNAN